MSKKVFLSFHYDNDVFRVQQIRNMGKIDDTSPELTPQAWESVTNEGEQNIKNWIDERIARASIFIVLIGSETSNRKWCNYEFKKALSLDKKIIGIYIHNLKCPKQGFSQKGNLVGSKMDYHDIFLPTNYDTYNDIKEYLSKL